jgi:hypothetical protein
MLVLLVSCGPSRQPEAKPAPPDPTREAWYGETVQQLSKLNAEAEQLFRRGKQDEAAALIREAEPLSKRLLGVPRPTLEAVVAASDLDDLYGRMLLSNRHYGWARMQFQKNVARWKNWRPVSEESAKRLAAAEAAVAECDRRLSQ